MAEMSRSVMLLFYTTISQAATIQSFSDINCIRLIQPFEAHYSINFTLPENFYKKISNFVLFLLPVFVYIVKGARNKIISKSRFYVE